MASKFHDQKEAACVQLDRAIALFLDEKDYYSALTLAGAAEEIFGQIVVRSGGKSAFTRVCGRINDSLTLAEREAIREEEQRGRTKDGVKAELNSARNWLKHSDGTEDQVYMDIEREAFDLLERAIESRSLLLNNHPPSSERFHLYAAERHSAPLSEKIVCPSCGQKEGVPLRWGDPDSEMRAACLRGELMLSGCLVEVPRNHPIPGNGCLDCDYRW